MQAAVFQELQNQIAERNILNATDPELIRLSRKRLSGEQLDNVERGQVRALNRVRFRQGNSAYLQFVNGIITQEQLSLLLSPLIETLSSNEDVLFDWENSVTVSEAFRSHITSVMHQ